MAKRFSTRNRLIIIGLMGGCVLFGAAAHYCFWLRRPVGSGPAGSTVSAALFERQWTTRSVLLVGLGDSVTAGFGARKGYSYFDRLVANPSDEFAEMDGRCLSRVIKDLSVTNLALSGSTSLSHLKMGLARLKVQPTNVFGVVAITTGGNDIIHNYGMTLPKEGAMYGASLTQAKPWIENFEKRLENILSEIEARFPGGCHIYLANIYDPTDGVGDAEKAGLPHWPDGLAIIASYKRIIDQCASKRQNVYLVDIHSAFLGHGIHCAQFWRAHYCKDDPYYWFHENLEDPNERGYDALRRLFLLRMAQRFTGEKKLLRP